VDASEDSFESDSPAYERFKTNHQERLVSEQKVINKLKQKKKMQIKELINVVEDRHDYSQFLFFDLPIRVDLKQTRDKFLKRRNSVAKPNETELL